MPTIDANGETLHYVRRGSGKPLVLVHSLGTAAWLWDAEIDHWSKRFDVIAFDTRGHGASSHNGTVTTRAIAADLRDALAALGITSAHFLGISMGGLIITRLYELDPSLFRTLVIADSFHTQGEAGHQRVGALTEKLNGMSMAEYGQVYADETLLPETSRDVHAKLAKGIGETPKDAYIETIRSIFTEDISAPLKTIGVPVLVVVGEKDNRTPPRLSEAIVGLVAGAEYRVVPDAAHLANLDNPAGFRAAVDPFLEAHSS